MTTTISDPFDLSDISDIPESLVESMKERDDILAAFVLAKRPLNLDQLIVYMWRVHKKEMGRRQVNGRVAKLHRNGYIEPTGRKGEYILKAPNKRADGGKNGG